VGGIARPGRAAGYHPGSRAIQGRWPRLSSAPGERPSERPNQSTSDANRCVNESWWSYEPPCHLGVSVSRRNYLHKHRIVFKTVEGAKSALAGSIPVRLREATVPTRDGRLLRDGKLLLLPRVVRGAVVGGTVGVTT
jgi:hypothetical protein